MKKLDLILVWLLLVFLLRTVATASEITAFNEMDIYTHGSVENVIEAILSEILFEGSEYPSTGEWMTPLTLAARFNPNPGVIDVLVDAGFDVNETTASGWSPLLIALVYNKTVEVADTLLSYGALLSDVNQVNMILSNGYTPLAAACEIGNTSGARKLLHLGANVNGKTTSNATALMLAAWRDDPSLIELLVEAGAEINSVDSDGQTILHYAVRGSKVTNVRSVLSLGVNVNARDNRGDTPLMLSYKTDITKVLIDAGADRNWHLVAKREAESILSEIVYWGSFKDEYSNEYYTSLAKRTFHPVSLENFAFNSGDAANTLKYLGDRMHSWEIKTSVLSRDRTEAIVTFIYHPNAVESSMVLWRHEDQWMLGILAY